MATFISNPNVAAPRNDPWELWRAAAVLSKMGENTLADDRLKKIVDHPTTPDDLRQMAVERREELACPTAPLPSWKGNDPWPYDPAEDATERLADAMGDATHPMHEEHYEAEEEAFTRRYERESVRVAVPRSRTPAP